MIEKGCCWRLSPQNAPAIFPSSDQHQRDWMDRFEHSPQRVIQLKKKKSKGGDVRTACMASANAITLHLSRLVDNESVHLDHYDQMIKVTRQVSCLAFGHSRHDNQVSKPVLASGHVNGEICLWHADSSQLLTRLISHSGAVTQIVFSSEADPDDSRPTQIISVAHDRTAKVWDLEDYGYNMCQTLHFPSAVFCSAWHKQMLAFGGASQKVYVHQKNERLIKAPALHLLAGHLHNVVAVKFWPDGSLLVSASWDGRVHIWDPFVGSLKQVISLAFPLPHYVFPSQIKSMDISRHGNAIVTLSDKGLSVWDPMTRLLHVTDNSCFVLNTSSEAGISLLEGEDTSTYRSCTFAFEDRFMFASSFSSAKTQCIAVQLPVPSLKHLSRLIIRNAIPQSPKLRQLSLPPILLSYLAYDLWN